MEKPNTVLEFFDNLNEAEKRCFNELRTLIHAVHPDVCEILFAHQPYFYLPQYEHLKSHFRPSVMMTFFKDHVNIFAQGNKHYESQLPEYQFTEKHTLQIYFNQSLQKAILLQLFKESLYQQ